MHLTIDGLDCNRDRLTDEKLVRDFLDQFPEKIGMHKISEPHAFEYHGDKPEDWGVSGFVLIAESHIAVHTFPEHQQVWVDIFSCKGFETTPSVQMVVDTFAIGKTQVHLIERGLEYPHDVKASIPLNRHERQLQTPIKVR